MNNLHVTMNNPADMIRTYFVTFKETATGEVHESSIHGYSPEEVGAHLLDDYEGIEIIALYNESKNNITKEVFGE